MVEPYYLMTSWIFLINFANSLTTPQGDGVLLLLKKILIRHSTSEEVYLHRGLKSISSLLDTVLNGVYNMSVTYLPLTSWRT